MESVLFLKFNNYRINSVNTLITLKLILPPRRNGQLCLSPLRTARRPNDSCVLFTCGINDIRCCFSSELRVVVGFGIDKRELTDRVAATKNARSTVQLHLIKIYLASFIHSSFVKPGRKTRFYVLKVWNPELRHQAR